MEMQSKTDPRLLAPAGDASHRYPARQRRHGLPGVTLVVALVVPLVVGSAAWAEDEKKLPQPKPVEEIKLDYKSLGNRGPAERGPAERGPAERGPASGPAERGASDKAAREPVVTRRAPAPGNTASAPAPRGLPSKVLIQAPTQPAPATAPEPEATKRYDPRTPAKPNVRDPEARDRRGRADDRRLEYGHLDRMATEGGRQAADSRMAREGRREYFRLGFHEGLHAAFDDQRFARWYYRDGQEAGERDPDALSSGHGLGRDSAEHLARERSQAQVVAQFTDLGREPRRRPDDRPPLARYDLPRVAQPVLHQVFDDRPWYGHGYGDDWRGGWLDPWSLYHNASWDPFYHDNWADAGDALNAWRRAHRDRWQRWNEAERRRFESLFHYAFRHRLAQLSDQANRHYRDGVRAGWDHGLDLVADWQYRRGYGQGYEEALQRASERAFETTYPAVYRRQYDAVFDDWARNPKPALLGATLFDADANGVFEPGEALWVRFGLVNYGGAEARVAVRARGRAFVGDGERSLWLPRRSRLEAQELELRIDPRSAVRSEETLTLSLAGGFDPAMTEDQTLSFRIAHALELRQGFELVAHNSLAGRATVAVEMINGSRRPASGRLVLFAGGRTYGGERSQGVAPGERRRQVFELDGLHPLDVMAGTVTLRAEIHGETVHRDDLLDAFEGRLPELLSRREDPGLADYLLAVAAGERRASRREIERAQGLMLERLRHDWYRVVAAKGNPYRDDLRGGRETALGELVYKVERYRGRLRDRQIFDSLVPRIEALAESLPGAHPFLRRSMKNLAQRLRG